MNQEVAGAKKESEVGTWVGVQEGSSEGIDGSRDPKAEEETQCNTWGEGVYSKWREWKAQGPEAGATGMFEAE